jgi:hypothetical protein
MAVKSTMHDDACVPGHAAETKKGAMQANVEVVATQSNVCPGVVPTSSTHLPCAI